MSRLEWSTPGSNRYEAGVDRGVFYPLDAPAEEWSGLVSVSESPFNSETRTRYVDGVKVGNRQTRGEFAATVEAFSYPRAFCDEFLRPARRRFDMSYRTMTDSSYKIHLVYNARAFPTDRNYVFDDAHPFSWDIVATPVPVPESAASAHLIVDGGVSYLSTMADLESILYGSEAADPRIPRPEELMQIFENHSILLVIDHGDGSWTATGPDDIIKWLDGTSFQIDWPSAVETGPSEYTLSSL